MINKYLLAVVLFCQVAGYTQPRLVINGLNRTDTSVVLQEFNFGSQQILDSLHFAEGLQRLRNMGIFSKVEGHWDANEAVVHLAEKWTTIPIFKASTGGGVNSLTAGIYDPNVFGKYLELGSQYQNYGGTHSGVIWWREPRLWRERTLFGGDLWLMHRLTESFNGDHSLGWSGWRRTRVHLFLEPELRKDLVLHLGGDLLLDTLNTKLLPLQKEQAAYERDALGSRTGMITLGLRYGQLNYDIESVTGYRVEPKIDLAIENSHHTDGFIQASLDMARYWLLHPRLNLAGHAIIMGGTQRSWFHQYRMGGLEQVRGLPDNFLIGSTMWYSNLEVRGTAFRGDWIRVQMVAFNDAGGVNFHGDHEARTTAGGGIRLLSPKIYRLNLRFDYAKEIGGSQQGLSAGLQQFF
jgi:outer membrane protein assembly factor BamA